MLGECNSSVRLQYRVTSSGATVDGLVCLFLIFVVVVAVVIFYGRWDGTKNWVFHEGRGDWGGSIDWNKYWSFFLGGGELGSLISAGQSHKRCKVATCECGKNLMGGYWN